MKPQRLIFLALALAAAVAAGPASAQMFKWVDENGVTHYSDRKPDDPKNAGNVKPVSGAVSVYSPDQPLLQAVEDARYRASLPEPVPAPPPAPQPYAAPAASMAAPPPPDPCAQGDCGYYYPYAPAPGFVRRPQRPLPQAQMRPGAIAGTVNSPGIIPGNTGTQFGVPTGPSGTPSRGTPSPPRPPLEPRSFR